MMIKVDPIDYQRLVENEKQHFSGEAPVLSIPSIFTYWASRYLSPRLTNMFGTNRIDYFFALEIERVTSDLRGKREVRILSLGSGECSLEIEIATKLTEDRFDFRFYCTDISPAMLASAQKNIEKMNFLGIFEFIECDVNKDFPGGPWDVIIANHSLHHFVGLEHIFDSCLSNLTQDGAMIISDMIGRNGHKRWPEVLSFVEAAWKTLDPTKHYDRINQIARHEFVNFDCADGSFEGVRSEDILPLLVDRFQFERFLGYGGVPDIFLDRMYGGNFDPNCRTDIQFVDLLEAFNSVLLECGAIKPTMMFATLRKSVREELHYPTPARQAVRDPGL